MCLHVVVVMTTCTCMFCVSTVVRACCGFLAN